MTATIDARTELLMRLRVRAGQLGLVGFATGKGDWTQSKGPKGGVIWTNSATGAKRYQKNKPGGGGGGSAAPAKPGGAAPAPGRGKNFVGPPKPKAAPAPKKPKATPDQARQKIADGLAGKATVDQVADSLMGLTVKDIHQVRKQLGIQATGRKADLARQVATKALAAAIAAPPAAQGQPAPPAPDPAQQKKLEADLDRLAGELQRHTAGGYREADPSWKRTYDGLRGELRKLTGGGAAPAPKPSQPAQPAQQAPAPPKPAGAAAGPPLTPESRKAAEAEADQLMSEMQSHRPGSPGHDERKKRLREVSDALAAGVAPPPRPAPKAAPAAAPKRKGWFFATAGGTPPADEGSTGATVLLGELLAAGVITEEQYEAAVEKLGGTTAQFGTVTPIDLSGVDGRTSLLLLLRFRARSLGLVGFATDNEWVRVPTERTQGKWRNSRTGEVRYQSERPAGRGGGADAPAAGPPGAAGAKAQPGGKAESGHDPGMPRQFGRSGVKVQATGGILGTSIAAGVKSRLKEMFKGRKPPAIDDLADMAGVMEGATKVTARAVKKHGRQAIAIEWFHPALARNEFTGRAQPCKRLLTTDMRGEPYMYNELVVVDKSQRGGGVGTKVFGRAVEAARRLGVRTIRCHAARYDTAGQSSYTGYKEWPNMGYNEGLATIQFYNPALAAKIREAFPGATDIIDVMRASGGKEWWAQNGSDLHYMEFDVTDGSKSMKRYAEFIQDQDAKIAAKKAAPPGGNAGG